MQIKPYLATDFYKVSHAMNVDGTNIPALHPEKIETVYETLTPRQNTFFPYDDKMVVFGYEYFINELLKSWNDDFFNKSWDDIKPDFLVFKHMSNEHVYSSMVNKFKQLHNLGYLPLEIRSLPEGALVPMRVPVLSIRNTDSRFYWLPGFLETTLLANTFVTTGTATVARQFRLIAEKYANKSAEDKSYIDFQFHDFSQRGQHGDEASVLSGLGHLSSFKGTDAIPAVAALMDTYKNEDNMLFGASVVATEHSIMESLAGEFGTDKDGQIKAYESLINRNPNGILSVVSDTYDYWQVIDEVLPALKDKIMARKGKLVIRPDSLDEYRKSKNQAIHSTAEQLVVSLEALYDTFGGHINSKGYKVLDSHIGLIHGEGITLDNIQPIFDAILKAGFSAENVTFGVGAYVYSVKVSRDDFGQALKASACVINHQEHIIFKAPHSKKESFKRSPHGAVSIHGISGKYRMIENLTMDEASKDPENQMKLLYDEKHGNRLTPLHTVRQRILDSVRKELDEGKRDGD